MTPPRMLVVGGSSGIGLAVAEQLLAAGHPVTIAGRSADRLAAAATRLAHPDLATAPVDIGDEDAVHRLVAGAAPLAHVVVTAADARGATGPLDRLTVAGARAVLAAKLLGPWLVAKHAAAHLAGPAASLTFTSGISAPRPGPGTSVTTMANGGLEALTRALAVELAPVRVNAVCPGWTDTPLWDAIDAAEWHERRAALAARLPAGRIGRPGDVAQAVAALIANPQVTGVVLPVDGGQRLV